MKKPYLKYFFAFPLFLALSIISLVCARSAVGQVLIYEQPFAPNDNLEGFFSNVRGQVGADQFELSEDATVTYLQWYGFYTVDLDPNITSRDFELNFFGDEIGLPSPNPINQQIVTAQIQDTGFRVTLYRCSLDRFEGGNPTFSCESRRAEKVYQFSAVLTIPFPVTAGETNWISIAAIQANWLWKHSPSSPGGTKAYRNQRFSPPSSWSTVDSPYDQLAFSLYSHQQASLPSPIPALSGWNLILLTFLLIILVYKKGRFVQRQYS